MHHQDQTSLSESELAEVISHLEKKLTESPSDFLSVRNLLMLLDHQSPEAAGNGPYSRCNSALATLFHNAELTGNELSRDRVTEIFKESWQLSNNFNINKNFAITQIFEGGKFYIKNEIMHCKKYLGFFNENNAIMNICFSCYKVQILTQDVISLIHLHFILKKMKLKRNNTRKCMVEVRDDVPYPYKGYIYCESESEANDIIQQLKSEMSVSGLNNVYCGISHGCSEYGLAYPKFKYSADGAHRSFEQPTEWKKLEKSSSTTAQVAGKTPPDLNKSEVTLRDVIGFETWINYAEIIGDTTYKYFADIPLNKKPHPFTNRVKKQAAARSAQLVELKQRLSAE